MNYDKALKHLSKVDKVMARIIKERGSCTLTPKHAQSPYEALVESVVYQQLTGKAAATIYGRLLASFPNAALPAPEILAATPLETLRTAGLSRAKSAAVIDIALKTISGVVPASDALDTMGDDEIVERLTSIRGVGPWTVHMLLIFRMGRPDILPVSDYGVRKGYAQAYGLTDLPSTKVLAAAGELWRPHRSVAAWYLWRVLDA